MLKISMPTLINAFAVVATLLTIEACGSRSALPTGFSQDSSALESTPRREPQGSWMLPEAKNEDLLYVTNNAFYAGDVLVFSYPLGKRVGKISGFRQSQTPKGECVDKAGDVFIVFEGGLGIAEYAHGSKTRIALLHGAPSPYGCAIDPLTGDLAATGLSGHLAIFRHARGKPRLYRDQSISNLYFCSYDNRGNLYVDGTTNTGAFEFAELPKGSGAFAGIALSTKIGLPGQVQSTGTTVAVGDTTGVKIYRFVISGRSATLAGSTTLNAACCVNDFWIMGSQVIAANFHGEPDVVQSVNFFRYPAGGTATKKLAHVFGIPEGVVVSRATQ